MKIDLKKFTQNYLFRQEPCLTNVSPKGSKQNKHDFVIALAGNPNTGKSSVFNLLTGLRQHTGNWTGKTVSKAEGFFIFENKTYKLVDLPGTYSLLSMSQDEDIARNYILFDQPDCTVIVVDATCIERNLNLVLQILEITDQVVVALNLMDEAKDKGIEIDANILSRELGVPVIPISAKKKEGFSYLLRYMSEIAHRELKTKPHKIESNIELQKAVAELIPVIEDAYPKLKKSRWIALRLLGGDPRVRQAVLNGEIEKLIQEKAERKTPTQSEVKDIIERADFLRRILPASFQETITSAIFNDAQKIAEQAILKKGERYSRLDRRIDRLLTSPASGLAIMTLCLTGIFWLTIVGSNYPSEQIAKLLFWIEDQGSAFFTQLEIPWWITGFLWHGVYRGLAWVVAVMLPPMAIFFPLFTILEDLGFLPRIAFNMDRLFKKCGAHGKQALTICMGFGCNAAAIVSTRIIDSPRERMIAILTNNFVPCNGRFPTLIMLANVFVATAFPPIFASVIASGSIVLIVIFGIVMTLLISKFLSQTILKGEPSTFTLELPPYRRPNILRVLYTSIIDRTVFVLYRAVIMAMPAGGIIWLLSNIHVADKSLTSWISGWLNPFGQALGLDGVIILAYIIAIPANEIVVPTILMAYTNSTMMLKVEGLDPLRNLLVGEHHWNILTAVCLMLFALLHNPCSTTIWTIWKETKSVKWTLIGTFMPLSIAFLVCFLVAQIGRALGFG